MNKKSAVVVGGGFAGITMSYFLKQKGFDVTILEASKEIGGGCRTYFYHNHPYTFGPHHLLVKVNEMFVLEFYEKFLEMKQLDHRLLTFVEQDSSFYGYPIHEDDISKMPDSDKIYAEIEACDEEKAKNATNFEEFWINSIGPTLYEKYIHRYSEKMWQIYNNQELDIFSYSPKGAAIKKGSRTCFEGVVNIYYPTDINGYNNMFDALVEDCEVKYETPVTKFDLNNKRVFANGTWYEGDVIINTASLDFVFNYCYGELRYIGREFTKIILPVKYAFGEKPHFLHYAGSEEYTRIVEYKKMTGYESDDTLIIIEKPSFKNKLYPYVTKADIQKAEKYKALIPEGCYSIGRMGKYHYDNMDQIVKDCMELIKEID
ncbi:MAG: UDP-galactopyranose mutase [Candidatus Marinarcus sp.]|uniref:UDP-galactopyranose mutase n=1 Tax=Candidatus Marinarcus sp. TaxID=3100987 RepID=UPI003B00F2F1